MAEKKSIAIIGTSPLSLLKGWLLVSKNQNLSITYFDVHDRIGGAWYNESSPKGHEIECGCHIWSHAPKVYAFIEKELGVPLRVFNPAPRFVHRKIHLPYSLKKTIDSYKFFSKSLLKGKLSAGKQVKMRPEFSFQLLGKKNKYPALGSPELTNALVHKLKDFSSVEFKVGEKVTVLEINDGVLVKTDKSSYQFDEVQLTSVSDIDEIKGGGEPIHLEKNRMDYIHFLLENDQPFKRKVNYWRLMKDSIIHRLADISYQTNGEENLMLVGIKQDGYYSHSEEELVNYVSNALKQMKIIEDKQALSKRKTHIFPTYYIKPELRAKINNYAPQQLQLFHTTDIMYGMHYLLEEFGY